MIHLPRTSDYTRVVHFVCEPKPGLGIVFTFAGLLAVCRSQGNPTGTEVDHSTQTPSQSTDTSPQLSCTEKSLPDIATIDGEPFGILWKPPLQSDMDFTGVTNPDSKVPLQTVDSQGDKYVIELKPTGEITVQSLADMSVVEFITQRMLDPQFPLIIRIGEGYYAFAAPCDADHDGRNDPSEVLRGTLVPIPKDSHPEATLFGTSKFAWDLAPTPTSTRPLVL